MKYETPELTTLTPAINAIQGTPPSKDNPGTLDGACYENPPAYADWE